jgi:hypothetical protein
VDMSRLAPPTNTLGQFMEQLSPGRKIESWFTWPPDIFALSGLLLKSTGAYRFAVEPPEVWPVDKNWEKTVEQEAKEWHLWIWGYKKAPKGLLRDHMESLKKHQATSVDRLTGLSHSSLNANFDRDAWYLCRALLELLSISDQACRGFGLSNLRPNFSGTNGVALSREHAPRDNWQSFQAAEESGTGLAQVANASSRAHSTVSFTSR